MPRYPAPYDPYSGGDTIGDLIRQRGDIYAQNALQSGQIWGQGLQNIAGTLGQGFQAWEQGRAEEKKQKAMTVQAQAVNDAIDRKDFPALLKILPPDKAKTIIEGLKAHDPDEVNKFKDPTDVFVAGAKMNEALPEANRPKAWALQVQSWTQKGYITPEQAEQYADPSNAARIAKLKDKPKEEKAPEGFTLGEGQQRFDAQGNVIAKGAEKAVTPKEVKSPWGQPFTAPDGASYQRNEQSGEIRPTPGVGKKPEEVKPPTTEQGKAASFYSRALEAADNFDKVAEKASPLEGHLWTAFQGKDTQLAEQAKEQFALAVLRKESGATISKDEKVQVDHAYFPQPGESKASIDQKAKARRTILEGLKNEAGRAGSIGSGAPKIGETRSINGRMGQWDGTGWVAVS